MLGLERRAMMRVRIWFALVVVADDLTTQRQRRLEVQVGHRLPLLDLDPDELLFDQVRARVVGSAECRSAP